MTRGQQAHKPTSTKNRQREEKGKETKKQQQ